MLLVTATPSSDEAARDDDDAVQRALSVPTRAGIYRRLRAQGSSASAKEVADWFGLHPNVARNHLDQLADAGLLVTSRRKHPGGGRPAKVYVAREQDARTEVQVPPGSQLGVHVVVQLIAGLTEHEAKLELLAEAQGRRLVSAQAGRAETRSFGAAVVVAVEALRAAFPEARIADDDEDRAVIEGLDVALRQIGEVDGAVGNALARGFIRGAVLAAGAAARVTSQAGRVTVVPDPDGQADVPGPTSTVDARGKTYQAGVVTTMRAMVALRPGDYLEVLTDLKGAPAAFARWADRAGHQIIDVTRIRDSKGRQAVRLLLRKATG